MDQSVPQYILRTPGYSPQLGHLVCMMENARARTIELVRDLGIGELDYLHDEESNSIGALLLHIAAVETVQQVWSFEGRELDERELAGWGAGLRLGDRARREIWGRAAGEYIDCLLAVRARTREEFRRRDDSWLYRDIPGRPMNQYYRWFHVLEDEISHRGQIKWLKIRAQADAARRASGKMSV